MTDHMHDGLRVEVINAQLQEILRLKESLTALAQAVLTGDDNEAILIAQDVGGE